jgi:hypothetical protein
MRPERSSLNSSDELRQPWLQLPKQRVQIHTFRGGVSIYLRVYLAVSPDALGFLAVLPLLWASHV